MAVNKWWMFKEILSRRNGFRHDLFMHADVWRHFILTLQNDTSVRRPVSRSGLYGDSRKNVHLGFSWKESSVKCSEHNFEYLVGLKPFLFTLCSHFFRSSGLFSGYLCHEIVEPGAWNRFSRRLLHPKAEHKGILLHQGIISFKN